MGLPYQNMSLVLSSDAKPRLKWTPELHSRFVEATVQLGGPDKATPKGLMKLMKIPGLTLYHLKSHLQKFRLGKDQLSDIPTDRKPEGDLTNLDDAAEILKPANENLQIARALQMQMEVQRQLHQQIEVQRHLQLRIEAQGKYLQSVLKKAQETLSGHSLSTRGTQLANYELSQLVSLVDNGCQNSSLLSDLTETESCRLQDLAKGLVQCTQSNDSSLTSSPAQQAKVREVLNTTQNKTHIPNASISRKRTGSTISDANCFELVEQQPRNRLSTTLDLTLDLNTGYQTDNVSEKHH